MNALIIAINYISLLFCTLMNCDEILLNEIINGSVHAYEQLFKKYYKQLCFSALYFLKDDVDAEEQVQQLFIEIWEKKLYLNITISVKAYLHKAITNRCLKVISLKKTTQKKLKEYAVLHSDDVDDLNEIADEKNNACKKIIESLNELPFQRKQAFKLVYIQNKKYKDAAEEMGISINSIKTHLKLALKTIRQKFSTH